MTCPKSHSLEEVSQDLTLAYLVFSIPCCEGRGVVQGCEWGPRLFTVGFIKPFSKRTEILAFQVTEEAVSYLLGVGGISPPSLGAGSQVPPLVLDFFEQSIAIFKSLKRTHSPRGCDI